MIRKTRIIGIPIVIPSGYWPAIGVAVAFLIMFSGCMQKAPEYEFVVPDGDRISIRISRVNDNTVHFFTFRHRDKNINFFVRTDGTGNLHTHYDACYSCFKYKMGFHAEGDHIRCLACNLKYRLTDEFWDYIGACAPIPLSSHIENGCIEIELDAVLKGEKLF